VIKQVDKPKIIMNYRLLKTKRNFKAIFYDHTHLKRLKHDFKPCESFAIL